MISFNRERGGIVAPFPSFLTAQRANLRRRLEPALTHRHTKTEAILFSSTRVSQAWGKSHHPWRTTDGVREMAAPPHKHIAGIRDHSPSYPSIPSAALPYVQYQTHQIDAEMFRFVSICRYKSAGASGTDICRLERPRGKTAFPTRRPLPYPIPADRVRWRPCQPASLLLRPFVFTPFYWSPIELAVLLCWKAKPLISFNLITKMRTHKKTARAIIHPDARGCPFQLCHLPRRKSLPSI